MHPRILLFLAIISTWALAGEDSPPAIDATRALNDARDWLGGRKAYSGDLPMTVDVPGQAAEKATLAVAYQSPNQLRVRSLHETTGGRESILLVFSPEAIWAEGRIEPAGGVPEIRVKKVIVDKIDSFTLGVLKRLDGVEGIPHLLFARPGLLLEFTATCFSTTATASADGKEIVIEATRTREPEGLDEAADVLAGIRKVHVVIAKEDKRLLDVTLDGGTGGRLSVSYREIDWEKAPEATAFEYAVPGGVQVEEVDERIEKPGPTDQGSGMEPPK